ncbi:MAG: recombinase family protein [Atopobiaceae bacterium]|nr:recombinase family protein [Atopobiaceae bacterium]
MKQLSQPAPRPKVVTISPPPTSARRLRVAGYCRISTLMESQDTSIASQRAHYLRVIESNPGWELVDIYWERGVSGTKATSRPELQRLIADCKAGRIDMILTKSISRFSRSTSDCLGLVRTLTSLGVVIRFDKESINTMESSGEVLVTILASIAQQESASISANVRMGIEFGFQEGRGRLNYSTFLGYRRGTTPSSYAIVPAEARVVRRIYREFLEGYSPYMIAQRLEAEKVSAPAGGPTWYASTVRSILRNEKYCGDLLMQKYYTVDFLTHKTVKNEGQRPQYFVEDDHDPIVPKEVFRQVQGELRRRTGLANDPSKLRHGARLALNGRLVCGKCGRTLKRYVKPSHHLTDWRCRDRALVKKSDVKEQPGSRCDCRIVKERAVWGAVVRAFNQLPGERDRIVALARGSAVGELARIDALLEREREQTQALRRRLEETGASGGVASSGPETEVAGSAASETEFLRSRLDGAKSRKDALYVERAEWANKAVKARILLELVDQMTGMARTEGGPVEDDPACRDYEDFFLRTRVPLPRHTFNTAGRMVAFNNDFVIRYVDRIVVHDETYEVHFKPSLVVVVA